LDCNPLYDEGARFADQVATYAGKFGASSETTAIFEYVPYHGNDQRLRVEIGEIRYCPKLPCDMRWIEKRPSGEEIEHIQGVATVWPERGKWGYGYRIPAEAGVPVPLTLEKGNGPIRVHMR
jgi:hypothetical protein